MRMDVTIMRQPICTLRGHRYNFTNNNVFLSMKVVFIYANSTDPSEMKQPS